MMRTTAASHFSFVLDNSVLCGWFLANQADGYTEAIAALLLESAAAAPQLLQLEFVNVLRTGCRRGSIPIATRDGALAEAAWAAGVGVVKG